MTCGGYVSLFLQINIKNDLKMNLYQKENH